MVSSTMSLGGGTSLMVNPPASFRIALSLDTRVNVAFSLGLSLQLYAGPFISIGDYGQLRKLAAPGSFDFLDYGTAAGTVERAGDDTGAEPAGNHAPVGCFDLGRDTGEMVAAPPDDVLVLKVNYWLNP